MPPPFRSQREAIEYQLKEEAQHRPLELLLRIGRTILKNPDATKLEILANPVFREHIWSWLLGQRVEAQTAEAQTDLDTANSLESLPDETPPEEPVGPEP